MYIKIRLIITLTIITLGCNSIDDPDQSIEYQLKNDFNKTEIKELNRILNFFDELVLNQTKTNSISAGYRIYMENLKFIKSKQDFNNRLFADKSKIDSFIKDYRETQTFDEIWVFEYGYSYENREDTVTRQIIPKLRGKYINILDKAISKDSVFKSYKDVLIASGAIPPSVIAGFQKINDKVDFDDDLIRLIVVIHYISVKSYTKIDENKNLQTTCCNTPCGRASSVFGCRL
ncbi:MAG: hypothetical protein K9I94_08420 [Bacteroidales bacterium]|nr:hypothetical protein [Bacteroidales bacterium]